MVTNPAGKAVWYIESHLEEDLTLDGIAAAAAVSRFHLARIFALATGSTVMGYVRARRLTEAARTLAAGAPDILAVALAAGYGSHEAFTRAFREQFNATPESVRQHGGIDPNLMLEPLKMDETMLDDMPPPRLETLGPFLIAGIGERYDSRRCASIPLQWQKFAPHLGHIPGQKGRAAYGVLCNGDDAGNTEYITGVEVADFSPLPDDWSRLRIAGQRYAVFAYPGHISAIRRVWFTIWNRGLPQSGYRTTGAPEFERYSEAFDGSTGMGGFEIWLPVEAGNR